MKFSWYFSVRWGVCLAVLFCVLQDPGAAVVLGSSTEVRDADDDDEGDGSLIVFGSDSEEPQPKKPEPVIADYSSMGHDLWTELAEELSDGVPADWVPGRVRSSAEIGLQHWEPFSSSGQYAADYDIDPVTVTAYDMSVRVKGWVFLADYKTSLTDPENMKTLLAQVSRIRPGAGMWWALYAETGHVEGRAGTEDELGNPIEYPVDTEWNRIGIELRSYSGAYGGLVWEDLTMPAIHTFNNEETAFAVFDDRTRARTLSLVLGYDKARYLLHEFKEGGAWAWSLEGTLGLGWLSYSEEELRGEIEELGYETESVELLAAGSIGTRLGWTYSKEVMDTDVQLYAGGRLRASGWMNLAGDAPESGTVELDTRFGLLQAGVFVRISFQW